jgi:hypothetical protein
MFMPLIIGNSHLTAVFFVAQGRHNAGQFATPVQNFRTFLTGNIRFGADSNGADPNNVMPIVCREPPAQASRARPMA